MRKLNVIKGDIVFQWKYGFYFIYIVLIVVYMVIFSFFEGNVKNMIVALCVYSDPAAMGMFFMGALILLEKSQRIVNSIAVSPVSVGEYISGKVISVGVISEIVGLILIGQGYTANYAACFVGIFMASVVFSLCGIIVGSKTSSLNQYIVWTVPFEVIGFVPVVLWRMGFIPENALLYIHPGVSAMEFIAGKTEQFFWMILSCSIWIVILLFFAYKSVDKMFRESGGAKL